MFSLWPKKKRIYLDHAAATPLSSSVKKAMLPYLETTFGNPSAIHGEGVKARQSIEDARQSVATILGIRPNGVVFTSGGTESNNLAILGYIKNLCRTEGVPYSEMEVVTTKIEHPSISALIPILKATGVKIRTVAVNEEGLITIPALEAVLSPKTVLVTFAYANSEVGAVQPVSRLTRVIRKYQKEQGTKIVVHVDAAQAPLWLPCALPRLGVDMMSLDVGKCNGPKGVGMLAVHGTIGLLPILHGGGQEQGLRPGTENVAQIVGAATALARAQEVHEERSVAVKKVRDTFFALLSQELPTAQINGPIDENRLPNNINISLPGFDTEYAVIYLDAKGVAASTKSACAGAGGGESVVVYEMTKDSDRARSTLRLSLGEENTIADMRTVLQILKDFAAKMYPLTK